MNQIQVIGTHNSYHREIQLSERALFEKYVPGPENYYYSHAALADQFDHQAVRSLELDLHSDTVGGLYANPLLYRLSNSTYEAAPDMTRPGLKVFHVTDADQGSVCNTFIECLQQLKTWSDAHPSHVPILIDLEIKMDISFAPIGGVNATEALNWTLPRLLNVDNEILSVLPRSKLIVPDDVRRPGLTLEQSVLQYGWPLLNDGRGKFMFYFDNEPTNNTADNLNIRNLYISGNHTSLQNRTVWTNSVEGAPDGAFLKRNQPVGNVAEIQRLVKKGYIVRTRADEPITTVLQRNKTMRDDGFRSGAQIVSTDYPWYGLAARWHSDYVVTLPGQAVARCNPVVGGEGCRDDWLE